MNHNNNTLKTIACGSIIACSAYMPPVLQAAPIDRWIENGVPELAAIGNLAAFKTGMEVSDELNTPDNIALFNTHAVQVTLISPDSKQIVYLVGDRKNMAYALKQFYPQYNIIAYQRKSEQIVESAEQAAGNSQKPSQAEGIRTPVYNSAGKS